MKDKIIQIHRDPDSFYGLSESGTIYALFYRRDSEIWYWEKIIDSPKKEKKQRKVSYD